jgi:hypothetical protein
MSIILQDHLLRVDTNEVGFSKENIEAICSIGQSSKLTTKQGVKHIGEKGIGFKSVFKIADVVWVASGHYNFKFDADEPLGRLVPVWADFPLEQHEGYTSILLEVRSEWDLQALEKELLSMEARILMFLRNIDFVKVETRQGEDKQSVVLSRQSHPTDTENLQVLCLEPDVQSPYKVYKYKLSGIPHNARGVSLGQSDIVLAFPAMHPDDAQIESQSVYAFLPVRDYGLKVIILPTLFTVYLLISVVHFTKRFCSSCKS